MLFFLPDNMKHFKIAFYWPYLPQMPARLHGLACKLSAGHLLDLQIYTFFDIWIQLNQVWKGAFWKWYSQFSRGRTNLEEKFQL